MSGNGVTPPGRDSLALALVEIQNSPPQQQQAAHQPQQPLNRVAHMVPPSYQADGRASLRSVPGSIFLDGGAGFEAGEGSSSYKRKGRPRRYGPDFSMSVSPSGVMFSPPPATRLPFPPEVEMPRPPHSVPRTTMSAGLAMPSRVQLRPPSQAGTPPPQLLMSRPRHEAAPQSTFADWIAAPPRRQMSGPPSQAVAQTTAAAWPPTPPQSQWQVSGPSSQAAAPATAAAWISTPPQSQWQVSRSPPQSAPTTADSWLETLRQLQASRPTPPVTTSTTAAAWQSTHSQVHMRPPPQAAQPSTSTASPPTPSQEQMRPPSQHAPPSASTAAQATPSQVQLPSPSEAAPPTTTASGLASPSPAKKRRGGPPHGSMPKKQRKPQQIEPTGSPDSNRLDASVITAKPGEDLSWKIMSRIERDQRDMCIMSGNGEISSATIRQPTASGGTATYEGRFHIVSLSGSFLRTGVDGQSITGGLSISLQGPDGYVFGGPVAGLLIAASPVQVVAGSFRSQCFEEPEEAPNNDEPSVASQSVQPGGAPGAKSGSSERTHSNSSGGSGGSINPTPGSTRGVQGM